MAESSHSSSGETDLARPPAANVPSLGQLASPPRTVPRTVRWRVMVDQSGMGSAIGIGLAVIMVVIGGMLLMTGQGFGPDNSILARSVGLIAALAGMGVASGIVVWLATSSKPVVRMLETGRPVTGKIASVYDRNHGGFQPYDAMIDEWAQFQKSGFGSGLFSGVLKRQLHDWRVRVRLDEMDSEDEREARMDIWPRLSSQERDPRITMLVGQDEEPLRGMDIGRHPWLRVSSSGEWDYESDSDFGAQGWLRSLGHALLVVVPTYCLAAWGASRGSTAPFGGAGGPSVPPLLGAFVAILFTVSHGVVPVFFYRVFANAEKSMHEQAGGFHPARALFSGFRLLHMGIWYGAPMIILGVMTGWYSLGWTVFHVLFARSGWKQWVFLEHGSTAMALLLFLVLFSGTPLFPIGIVVVIFQALLLTLVEWKGRPLWTPGETGP